MKMKLLAGTFFCYLNLFLQSKPGTVDKTCQARLYVIHVDTM